MKKELAVPVMKDALARAKKLHAFLEGAAAVSDTFIDITKDAFALEVCIDEALRALDPDSYYAFEEVEDA